MNKYLKTTLLIVTVLALQSCASRYRKLAFDAVTFQNQQEIEGYSIAYAYDIMYQSNNKKIFAREKKKNYTLLALKITNTSSESTIFDLRKYKMYDERGNLIIPIERTKYTSRTDINFYKFLWYLPFMFGPDNNNNTVNNQVADIKLVIPVFVIAVGNLVYQAFSNGQYNAEIRTLAPFEKNLRSGETKYFVVPIPENDYQSILFKID